MRKFRQPDHLFTTTTTREEFGWPTYVPFKREREQEDQVEAGLLVTGKFKKNLYIEPFPIPRTKLEHLYAKDLTEKYVGFGKTIADGFPHTFDKDAFLEEKLVSIQEMLTDYHNRTNYQISHCRRQDGIVSERTIKRDVARSQRIPKHWSIDTTNQATYREPKDIGKSLVETVTKQASCRPQPTKDKLGEILRDVFRIRDTTYEEMFCKQAELSIRRGVYGKCRDVLNERHNKL